MRDLIWFDISCLIRTENPIFHLSWLYLRKSFMDLLCKQEKCLFEQTEPHVLWTTATGLFLTTVAQSQTGDFNTKQKRNSASVPEKYIMK